MVKPTSPTARTLLARCSYSVFFSLSPPCHSPPSPRSPLGSDPSIESSIALFPRFPACPTVDSSTYCTSNWTFSLLVVYASIAAVGSEVQAVLSTISTASWIPFERPTAASTPVFVHHCMLHTCVRYACLPLDLLPKPSALHFLLLPRPPGG